jgi:hypothetical protein
MWSVKDYVVSWSQRLVVFSFVQGLVQIILAVTGISIIRNLPKEEYGLYIILLSIVSLINILAEGGLVVAIKSLIGSGSVNSIKLGKLVNASLAIKQQKLWILTLAFGSYCLFILHRNNVSALKSLILTLGVAATCLLSYRVSILLVSLQIYSKVREIQYSDLVSATARLLVISGLVFITKSSVVFILITGFTSYFLSQYYLQTLSINLSNMRPENSDFTSIKGISRKVVPNTVFYCFQGQIVTILLMLFGRSESVAEVGAFSRLAAILAIPSSIVATIAAPTFGRCTQLRKAAFISGGVILGLAISYSLLIIGSWRFPELCGIILGSNYEYRDQEFRLAIILSCLSHLSSTMWNLNSSRGWISKTTKFQIPLTIFAELLVLPFCDVSTPQGALLFGIVGIFASIPLLSIDFLNGFRKWSNK